MVAAAALQGIAAYIIVKLAACSALTAHRAYGIQSGN